VTTAEPIAAASRGGQLLDGAKGAAGAARLVVSDVVDRDVVDAAEAGAHAGAEYEDRGSQGPHAHRGALGQDGRPHARGASECDAEAGDDEHPPQLADQRAEHHGHHDDAHHERAQGDRRRGRPEPECRLEEQRQAVGQAVDGGEERQAEQQPGGASPVSQERREDQRAGGQALPYREPDEQHSARDQAQMGSAVQPAVEPSISP
jgi:hypothetical protein